MEDTQIEARSVVNKTRGQQSDAGVVAERWSGRLASLGGQQSGKKSAAVDREGASRGRLERQACWSKMGSSLDARRGCSTSRDKEVEEKNVDRLSVGFFGWSTAGFQWKGNAERCRGNSLE